VPRHHGEAREGAAQPDEERRRGDREHERDQAMLRLRDPLGREQNESRHGEDRVEERGASLQLEPRHHAQDREGAERRAEEDDRRDDCDDDPRQRRGALRHRTGHERLQGSGELVRVGVAIGGRARHRLVDDGDQRRRQLRRDAGERLATPLERGREQRDRRRTLVRRAPREQVIEKRPDREHVGARIDRGHVTARLLRRHVRRRSEHRPVERRLRARVSSASLAGFEHPCQLGAAHLGDAPVDHDHLAVRGDEHVVRLDVAVHHALRVCEAERVRHLHHGGQERDASLECLGLRDRVAERPARDAAHRIERATVTYPALVHRGDAGMLEVAGPR
jgi:hypothetical protein